MTLPPMKKRIKIDKDVPMPAPGRRIYPFDQMEIGDSFEVPIERANSVTSSSNAFRVKHNKKLRLVRRSNTIEGTVRFWRVE